MEAMKTSTTNKTKTVKIPKTRRTMMNLETTKEAQSQFQHEAVILANLSHPNIVAFQEVRGG